MTDSSKPTRFVVEVYDRVSKEVVDTIGKGDDLGTAERICRGVEINMNHTAYGARVVPQRLV